MTQNERKALNEIIENRSRIARDEIKALEELSGPVVPYYAIRGLSGIDTSYEIAINEVPLRENKTKLNKPERPMKKS